MRALRSVNSIQSVPCLNGQPVVLPLGQWVCSNPQTDPVWFPPSVSPVNCNRHQAPSGYQYILYNGQCVLVNRATGQPAITQAGQGTILTTASIVTNTLTSLPSTLNTWYQNNKTLALILAGTAIYFLTKKK